MDYYLIYKPYGMLSQFTREGNHKSLADLGFNFPKDVYSVGRLDHDSEGLLLLTNDNFLKTRLLDPKFKQEKTYWAQVDNEINDEAIHKLEVGVSINHKGKKYQTLPCFARKLETPLIPEREPPIRIRKNIPTSWLQITLTEGKNRQVRKMTAAVGFPTLRLIRVGFGPLSKKHLEGTQIKKITEKEIYNLLKIKY